MMDKRHHRSGSESEELVGEDQGFQTSEMIDHEDDNAIGDMLLTVDTNRRLEEALQGVYPKFAQREYKAVGLSHGYPSPCLWTVRKMRELEAEAASSRRNHRCLCGFECTYFIKRSQESPAQAFATHFNA